MMSRPPHPMHLLFAGAIFAVSWLSWSGVYTPLLNGLGVLSCGIVLWLATRAGFFDAEVYSLHLCARLPAYWWWLAREIVKANLVVARIVLSRRMPISPTWVTIDASKLTPVGQAILANAITLTPATVAVDAEAGVIHVHCLTEACAAELREGELMQRTIKLIAN